jgi:hypothetical protein
MNGDPAYLSLRPEGFCTTKTRFGHCHGPGDAVSPRTVHALALMDDCSGPWLCTHNQDPFATCRDVRLAIGGKSEALFREIHATLRMPAAEQAVG